MGSVVTSALLRVYGLVCALVIVQIHARTVPDYEIVRTFDAPQDHDDLGIKDARGEYMDDLPMYMRNSDPDLLTLDEEPEQYFPPSYAQRPWSPRTRYPVATDIEDEEADQDESIAEMRLRLYNTLQLFKAMREQRTKKIPPSMHKRRPPTGFHAVRGKRSAAAPSSLRSSSHKLRPIMS